MFAKKIVGLLRQAADMVMEYAEGRSAGSKLADQLYKASDSPIPGQEYRHPKTGNRYTVLAVGCYCGGWSEKLCKQGEPNVTAGFPEGTELVVYVGHYNNTTKPGGNRVYIRPVSEWMEEVTIPETSEEPEHKAQRFEPVV